jgi:hypothetical protein
MRYPLGSVVAWYVCTSCYTGRTCHFKLRHGKLKMEDFLCVLTPFNAYEKYGCPILLYLALFIVSTFSHWPLTFLGIIIACKLLLFYFSFTILWSNMSSWFVLTCLMKLIGLCVYILYSLHYSYSDQDSGTDQTPSFESFFMSSGSSVQTFDHLIRCS